MIIFLVFLGLTLYAETEGQEEVGIFLFLSNNSSSFVNESVASIRLDNMANYFLVRNPDYGQIQVIGYTASAKTDVDPDILALERAVFVINELQKRGVPLEWFSNPIGHGEVDLWGNNTNEETMFPNRRVRVLLNGSLLTPYIFLSQVETAKTTPAETTAAEVISSESNFKLLWLILFILLGLLLLALIIFLILFLRRKIQDKKAEESYYSSFQQNIPTEISGVSEHHNIPTDIFEDNENFTPVHTDGDLNIIHDIEPVSFHHESSTKKRSKFMEMEKTIKEIIAEIPTGVYFDVHTIVEVLLQEHDDVYLKSVGNYTTAAHYHSRISTIIGENTDIV